MGGLIEQVLNGTSEKEVTMSRNLNELVKDHWDSLTDRESSMCSAFR